MANSDRGELISAIYAATLSPRDFDKTLRTLDELLFENQEKRSGDADRQEMAFRDYAEILPHVELAKNIQMRVGREGRRASELAAILETVPNPSWVIDSSGKVLGSNGLANRRVSQRASVLSDCLADQQARERVKSFIGGRRSEEVLVISGYAETGKKGPTSILARRLEGVAVEGEVFLLTVVDFGFDRRTVELFRDSYDLTEAECHVAVLLASGVGRPEIAARRGVSIDTVSTQVKIIKQKTSVRDIPALVRLLCGFSAGLLSQPTHNIDGGMGDVPATLKSRHKMVLKDGRRLEYLEQGAAHGRPVLLLHNMPYGAELPMAAIERAYRDGLRFIAPLRPGAGNTDPIEGLSDRDYLAQSAKDAEALLTHLGIKRVAVVSHTIGSAYALKFAQLFPERVLSLIAVSRAPIWRDAWLKQTPKRQRFVLKLARYFPQLLPVFTWALISFIERGAAQEFVIETCRDGKADVKALENPETMDLILEGSVAGLRHGTETFYRDTIMCVTDFTAEARATPHKFHILHGDDDAIVNIEQSRTFAREVPGTTVEVVEGAGQLLFYSHWPRVLDAVEMQLERLSSELAL